MGSSSLYTESIPLFHHVNDDGSSLHHLVQYADDMTVFISNSKEELEKFVSFELNNSNSTFQ